METLTKLSVISYLRISVFIFIFYYICFWLHLGQLNFVIIECDASKHKVMYCNLRNILDCIEEPFHTFVKVVWGICIHVQLHTTSKYNLYLLVGCQKIVLQLVTSRWRSFFLVTLFAQPYSQCGYGNFTPSVSLTLSVNGTWWTFALIWLVTRRKREKKCASNCYERVYCDITGGRLHPMAQWIPITQNYCLTNP